MSYNRLVMKVMEVRCMLKKFEKSGPFLGNTKLFLGCARLCISSLKPQSPEPRDIAGDLTFGQC